MKYSFCSFYLDDNMYGIPVQVVQEVLREQALTPVPLAEGSVGGLLNLRGRILTVLDLRARLGLPARRADLRPMHILVRPHQETLSLLVDRIGDVIAVEESQFEQRPEGLKGGPRALLLGAYKVRKGLLLALDVSKAAELE